jgi:dihydroflavonol-4-reductase
LDVELVRGDLRDAASVKTAVRGCDALFHTAALYTLWTRTPAEVYATNVAGTETVMKAALAQGIEKIVYTSSESAVACAGDGTVATEETGYTEPNHAAGDYKRSKCLAEQLVLKLCQAGLPAVIVNPTTPLGPHDYKPTPTGRIVVDFLNGRMPAYVETGFNFVDVEDVAAGHLLALRKGTPGQRYLLGNQNMTFKEMLELLGQVAGRKPPRWRMPLKVAENIICFAAIFENVHHFTDTVVKPLHEGVVVGKVLACHLIILKERRNPDFIWRIGRICYPWERAVRR